MLEDLNALKSEESSSVVSIDINEDSDEVDVNDIDNFINENENMLDQNDQLMTD